MEAHPEPVRRVIQEDRTGCGIACIAMLAGTTYRKVRKAAVAMFDYEKAGGFYTETRHLRELGAAFNVTIAAQRRRKFKGWEQLPDAALVAINPRENNFRWHWVVFVRQEGSEFVLDPRAAVKTERRTDFRRMKAFAFLPAERTAG